MGQEEKQELRTERMTVWEFEDCEGKIVFGKGKNRAFLTTRNNQESTVIMTIDQLRHLGETIVNVVEERRKE